MATPHPNKWAGLALALVAAGQLWAAPVLAEGGFTCPQASLDTQPEQPVVNFLKLPAWPDAHFYALVVANGQSDSLSLSPVNAGLALPARAGWLYFIAAHRELAPLAAYRIRVENDSKGVSFVQAPLPEDGQALMPGHLNGVPEDAQVCALRL